MRKRIIGITAALCLVISMFLSPAASFLANAETGTKVSGTVSSDSTDSLLRLKTSNGIMEIKIDSSTDTSECKVLLVGDTVYATVYRGSDAYMHASKISNGDDQTNATVDTAHTATVDGTIASGTTSKMIYFSTKAGTMQIKLDDDTDMNDCGILTIGKEVSIKFGRGSDAYMHAITITKKAEAATTVTVNGQNLPNIYGTIGNNTSKSYMYLNTSNGSMEIKIDSTTDISKCKALITSQPVYVACYRGSDAYMHAAKITSALDNNFNDATVKQSSLNVTGIVSSGTTPYLMYLKTSSGMMQIRLDSNTNMNGCPIILGETVSASLGYGSDSYHHAISVSEL
jgi:hypothetical protein